MLKTLIEVIIFIANVLLTIGMLYTAVEGKDKGTRALALCIALLLIGNLLS